MTRMSTDSTLNVQLSTGYFGIRGGPLSGSHWDAVPAGISPGVLPKVQGWGNLQPSLGDLRSQKLAAYARMRRALSFSTVPFSSNLKTGLFIPCGEYLVSFGCC